MGEDDDWPPRDTRTVEERDLDLLRGWLAQSHWNFSLGYNSFGGFSEGICLLGGIDPTESEETNDQYGPHFLLESLSLYWTGKYPSWADSWQLRYSVAETLRRYTALGLKGLVPVQKALLAADKVGLIIPWLEAASGDLECALRLPPALRTNDEIREQIRHRHSVAAGRSRAEKAAKTRFLNDHAKPIFDRMAERGFKDEEYAESSGRPVAARIAHRVYNETMSDKKAEIYLADNPAALPDFRAFASNVGKWIRALEKSSEQKKQ